MAINYKALTSQIDEALNSNKDRDEFVKTLASKPFTSKAQLFAIIIKLMDVEPAPADTQFEDMTQDQRELVTVYSQSAKLLGFIA